jgi:hypothetical protein
MPVFLLQKGSWCTKRIVYLLVLFFKVSSLVIVGVTFVAKTSFFPANVVVCISASKLFFFVFGSEFFVSWVEFYFIEAYNQTL